MMPMTWMETPLRFLSASPTACWEWNRRRANSWLTMATAGVLGVIGKAHVAAGEQRGSRGGQVARGDVMGIAAEDAFRVAQVGAVFGEDVGDVGVEVELGGVGVAGGFDAGDLLDFF